MVEVREELEALAEIESESPAEFPEAGEVRLETVLERLKATESENEAVHAELDADVVREGQLQSLLVVPRESLHSKAPRKEPSVVPPDVGQRGSSRHDLFANLQPRVLLDELHDQTTLLLSRASETDELPIAGNKGL